MFKNFISFLKNLFSNAQPWLAVAKTALSVIMPLVQTILQLTDDSDPNTTKIINEISNDLSTLNDVVVGINKSVSASTLIANLEANLPALLAAARISNPQHASEIEIYVNLILSEISAIAAVLPKK